ncbi:hypothetical protein PGTUg99_015248 [Puccinia graminis f. sp. tritici]|uniref:Uncharacterized protein n=1 Tax=Puccinia graminis f. sp. tritici TaxID=56615 RepID=A0A5B0S5N9_PUCGR|nr:hypothetical protein PGTUg99_015248 [Puccinia graminis f. sp. tritici]
MVSFNDLPAELIHKIVGFTLQQPSAHNSRDSNPGGAHFGLDHFGVEAALRRPRVGPVATQLDHHVDPDANLLHHANPTNLPRVSWPDGLPRNPLLALSLVNRPLRRCAQEMLFRKVGLASEWQAHLFLRALSRPSLDDGSAPVDQAHSSQENGTEIEQRSGNACPNRLGQYVRVVDFEWGGPRSMGRGGGFLLCDIIRSCPEIEHITIRARFFNRCQEPIFKALASCRRIQAFVTGEHCTRPTVFQWRIDELVDRLFSKWDSLHTIDVTGLCGPLIQTPETIPKAIPAINHALRSIILTYADLDEFELSSVLKGSLKSLLTLKIIYPSSRLDRSGLCRILKEDTNPDLEILLICVEPAWHRIRRSSETSDDPETNCGLIDIIFKTSDAPLRKLKTLSVEGTIIGSNFLTLLPQSLVKLHCEKTGLQSAAFVKMLSNSYKPDPPAGSDTPGKWLPNLLCCSIREDTSWPREARKTIEQILKDRGACFHAMCGFTDSDDDEEGEGPLRQFGFVEDMDMAHNFAVGPHFP